ncbi:protein lethal(2)essential for life-like [Bombyx mandarina]|uniref:Protein lethal(2)essential for life-like n=1 Tax=Bombyx mandarina TaxID=7092 RepID=A0A6J2J8Q0_BOMMA|nr:protein lethal(2)essential for life-like [Bombyx mandarina]
MSLLPYIFDYDAPRWPRRLLDQNFGLTITPEDLLNAATSPVVPRIRPWWPKDAGSSIKADKDKWQINVDVQHFAPDEVTVKIADGYIVIEGKHEEKQDEHGYISRQFVRRFKLPDDSNPDAVASRLSSDGVLTVVAPRQAEASKNERDVPITHTGPVRKEITEETSSK